MSTTAAAASRRARFQIRYCVLTAVGLSILAIAAYLPALSQSYISDDYVQIEFGRRYGPVSGWQDLAGDALYRCRATSLVLTWWAERLFGATPSVFYATSIALHVLNTWLIALLGMWRGISWRLSVPAAAFFAVTESHNEAVMWYAALPELLVFAGLLALLHFWIAWLESGRARWYVAAWAAFLFALASKESAAVAPLILAGIVTLRRDWPRMPWVFPFAGMALIYTAAVFAAELDHLHLNDGTFSLQAPVLLTLRNSIGRLLWFWGFLCLLRIAVLRSAHHWRVVGCCMVWIGITLLPYAFITYMPRVPSRHVYLASAGLAGILAAAWMTLRGKQALAFMALFIILNTGYLWTRKRAQLLERAAPTESLLQVARGAESPIRLSCFPYSAHVASAALKFHNLPAQVVLEPSESAAIEFCWNQAFDHARLPQDEAYPAAPGTPGP